MAFTQGYHLPFARPAAFFAAFWVWLVILAPLPIGTLPGRKAQSALALCPGRLFRLLDACSWRFIPGTTSPACSRTRSTSTRTEHRRRPTARAGRKACSRRSFSRSRFSGSGGRSSRTAGLAASGGSSTSGPSQAVRSRSAALILTLSGAHSSHSVVLRVLGAVGFLAIVALPIGIGIGILKYRLYDIDRLISRTLSYTILTGLLVGRFRRRRRAHDRRAAVLLAGRRRRLDTRRRSALQHVQAPRPAARRPALQPGPIRRRGDGRGVHEPPAGCRRAPRRSTKGCCAAVGQAVEPSHASLWLAAADPR